MSSNSNPPPSPHKIKEPPVTPPSKDRSHTRSKSTITTPSATTLPFHHRHPSQPSPSSRFTTDPTLASYHDHPIDADLNTDSPLHFSPSKARAAAQATHQLSILKRWLGSLSSPSTSSTSSNTTLTQLISKWEAEHRTLSATNPELAGQTVQWLQETMGANRLADERRRLVFEAKREEVERLERVETQSQTGPSVSTDVLQELHAALSPNAQECLDSIAATSVLLGHIPDSRSDQSLVRELGQAVMEHTLRAQDFQTNVEALEALQRQLAEHCEEARAQLAELEKARKAAVEEAQVMHPQTAQWNRETKQIAMKVKEYTDRVAVLERSRPVANGGGGDGVRVEEVVQMQERVKERRERVRALEKSVSILHGLPPDLEASRDEVRRAKLELERLKARRQALFGMLADT